MDIRKELKKHLELIIETNDQPRINASAKALAKKMVECGAKETYEELLEMLGYREVKIKKKGKGK